LISSGRAAHPEAPFLAPEPQKGDFIVAHDDPGIGAANEIAAS